MTEPPFTGEQDQYLRRKVKVELRKRMRSVRSTVPEGACGERSAAIVARLLAMPAVMAAKRAALFFPIVARHEVDLRGLDAALRAAGVRLAYPSIDPTSREMTFRFVPDLAVLEERGLGFGEPPYDAEEASDLDLIVVPALAADPTGQRIGYGAGFYDRTLPRFAPPAITVAVIFDYQLIAEVPTTAGDVPVGWVVTDTRTLEASP